jgi:hypothetical protein
MGNLAAMPHTSLPERAGCAASRIDFDGTSHPFGQREAVPARSPPVYPESVNERPPVGPHAIRKRSCRHVQTLSVSRRSTLPVTNHSLGVSSGSRRRCDHAVAGCALERVYFEGEIHGELLQMSGGYDVIARQPILWRMACQNWDARRPWRIAPLRMHARNIRGDCFPLQEKISSPGSTGPRARGPCLRRRRRRPHCGARVTADRSRHVPRAWSGDRTSPERQRCVTLVRRPVTSRMAMR